MMEAAASPARREFFRRLARLATFGLLAGGAGALAARAIARPDACELSLPCRRCRLAATCGFDQAVQARQAGSTPRHD